MMSLFVIYMVVAAIITYGEWTANEKQKRDIGLFIFCLFYASIWPAFVMFGAALYFSEQLSSNKKK